MSRSICALYDSGDIEAVALHQTCAFETAVQFSQAEGIVPASKSALAVKAATDESLKCKEDGTSRVIGFNLSGYGLFDPSAY